MRFGILMAVVAGSLCCLPAAAMAKEASRASRSACDMPPLKARDALIRVPFWVVDGRIYVEAKVNGKGPFRFAVDTGASGMGRADTSLVTALGLTPEQPTETSDGVTRAAAQTVRIDALTLGGITRRNLTVITRDYSSRAQPDAKMDGIIGREFFADGLLIIDYPSRSLRFTRARTLEAGDTAVLPYDRAFRVPVSVGGIGTEGNLDTGANVSFVMPQKLFDALPPAPLSAASSGTLSHGQIETNRATVAGPFRIGAAEASNVEVRVSKDYPELLVGAHFLQNYTVLIDQRSKSVALCPARPAMPARPARPAK